MKKTKLLGVTALLFSLGLTGCLGGNTTNKKKNPTGEKYETTKDGHYELDPETGDRLSSTIEAHTWEAAPNGSGSKKPKAATCLMPGQDVKVCTVCGRSEYVDTDPLGHDYEDLAGEGEAATCTSAGIIHKKCTRCQKEINEESGALGHDMQPVTVSKDSVSKSKCSRCDATEIIFDLSKAEGDWQWASDNGATGDNIKNEKCGSSSKQINAKFSGLTGIVDNGTYSIAIEARMVYDHSSRYFFNHVKNGVADDASSPDKSDQADYRYDFIVNDTTTIGLTNRQTYGDNGLSQSDYKYVEVVDRATLSGVTSFTLHHGSIGYSLCIKSVKLTKIA
jgi:hypothetical protein